MENAQPPELKITGERLLIFVDDTGHETFKGSRDYYGLGGCVVLGAHYAWMKAQWREVRRLINGNPDAPLHAADMKRTEANFGALAKFFLDPSFARIAAVSTKETRLPSDMHSAVPVMGTLAGQIEQLAKMIPCKGMTIIVESSQRADPILKQYFGQVQSIATDSGWPADHCLMPKSSGEPGLEVADFIISAAGSQAKRIVRGQAGLAPDFEDVFGRLPAIGCLFSFITEVEGSQAEGVVRMQGLRVAS